MARVRAILGTLLVVAGFVVALCFGLYAVGASDFPDYRQPNRYRAKPDLRALYLDVEAGGIEDVPRLNPVSAWGYRLWQLSGWQGAPVDSQRGLLSRAGRTLAMRQAHPTRGLRGHLLDSAATIRASRDWPLERMVDTILAESTFGRGAKGIEQAALAWYGRPLDDLVPEERLLLIALMKGPSHYDPVCRPERFAQRYPWAAKRAGFADAGSALRAALARMRPSACPASGTAPAP